MTAKHRQPGGPRPPARGPAPQRRDPSTVGPRFLGLPVRIAAGLAFVVVSGLAIAGVAVVANGGGNGAASQIGTTVQASGGHWTNVTPSELAGMLDHKDFTLLNVKTPYTGEIQGTDLYIPYDQLAARQSELPRDRSAKVLVYCRSGAESAAGAQTLLDLGYTNVWNLDGGMNAWTASGRALVNLNRQ